MVFPFFFSKRLKNWVKHDIIDLRLAEVNMIFGGFQLTIVLKALIVTIVFELIIVILLGGKKILFITLLLNLITNPVMNLLIQTLPFAQYDLIVLGLEALVVLVEGVGYYLVLRDFKKAMLYSFCANVTSYLVGLALLPIIY